jgi:Ni,Fe-hydrogenase III small subunit/formate hydrogenlyase subunit 6/NADH:ubiquinone oxidoreductase subunit I
MLRYLLGRIRRGSHTQPFPAATPLPERYRGRPAFDRSRCPAGCDACAAALPAGLLRPGTDGPRDERPGDRVGPPALDLGACLFTPEEAAACPHGALRFTGETRMAVSTRAALVTADGEVELARALDAQARRLFGRSLRLRSMVAGSCGGCEPDMAVLSTVVFDIARFGIQFVASPRHADGIVVTGPVNANMRLALEKTWRATPEPRLVIAVGACAISGGPFAGSPEAGTGLPETMPADLLVPGCPPHPRTLLDGLLRLLGRIERGERAGAPAAPPGGAGDAG